MLSVGGLFSGIGGIERGLERAGMRVAWHAEKDDYCRRVLSRHWPDVTVYDDVRSIGRDAERVDVLAGGFPCQHISQAAHRSARGDGWLWPDFARVIREVEPRWIVIENVDALRYPNRGLSEILVDLAALGFDAEWRSVRASWFGASHHRARIWVVAHSDVQSQSALPIDDEVAWLSQPVPVVPGWRVVPDLRMADGVPHRVLRRQRLGNAVVPVTAEWIGRCILAQEGRLT